MALFIFCASVAAAHVFIVIDFIRWQRQLDPAHMTPRQRLLYLSVKTR